MEVKVYTLQQVADVLGFKLRTIRQWVKDGKLEATKLGREYRVTQEQLEKLLKGDR